MLRTLAADAPPILAIKQRVVPLGHDQVRQRLPIRGVEPQRFLRAGASENKQICRGLSGIRCHQKTKRKAAKGRRKLSSAGKAHYLLRCHPPDPRVASGLHDASAPHRLDLALPLPIPCARVRGEGQWTLPAEYSTAPRACSRRSEPDRPSSKAAGRRPGRCARAC